MAKTALFLSDLELKERTSLDGSTDPDKILQNIEVTQDLRIQPILGYELYNKLQDDIINSTLTGDYLDLLNEFIKPVLAHYSASDLIPFLSYTLANGGVFKHNAENSQIASDSESSRLSDIYEKRAEVYKERLIDYLCANSSKFPEYYQSTNGRVSRSQSNNPTNWIL